ncbi:2'-5' RNA ligase family protein [Polycladomyces sp. WAk]|uniref:2'-5' RNA ligase family protein n=1 Tax=Polycladomyces zharkentensis TaxID=2807616 RepID=A0ABS2WMN9_9BACL|nr:2'-5' RNA ligase family protein [Polycladomyces sp. WAk]MBN2910786.1 2'-5' RNA ligase family protein [Polycladomyces sp. WAk]
MHAIVSLLDEHHYQQVENLWAELRNKFGLDGIYKTPYPHFSYQIAEEYDFQRVEDELKRLSRQIPSFSIRTSGLGIFTGTDPVLYVPIVRSSLLDSIHRTLLTRISNAANKTSPYYGPDHWIPHITIAQWNLDKNLLSKAISYVYDYNFYWTIQVNNFAIIEDDGKRQFIK